MLNRAAQFGGKIEAAEGVEEALVAADFAGNRKTGDNTPFSSVKLGKYDRELKFPSLSNLASLLGDRSIGFKFSEEAVGGGIATAAPWHKHVRGCGFGQTGLKVVTLGSGATGPGITTWKVGNQVSNNVVYGSATVTAIFVHIVPGSPNKMVYVPLTGAFGAADVVYNNTLTASIDCDSAPTDAGYRFAFQTETDAVMPPSLTLEERLGGERHTGIGCRGNGGLSIKRNEPLLFNYEYAGAAVFDSNDKSFRAGGVVTSVPSNLVKPMVARGITLNLTKGATVYAPIMTMLDLKFGNTLAPRATMGASLANSGFLSTRITARKPTTNIDPERVVPATFDFVAEFVSGDVLDLEAKIGVVNDGNGLVLVHAPTLQLQGDLNFGDRDGMTTVPAEALLTGSNDDELYLYHIFVP